MDEATSAHFVNGVFTNTEPSTVLSPSSAFALTRTAWAARKNGVPTHPVPLVSAAPATEAAELAVTWYGHSSVLIEIDGHRVLADPVWGERASPSSTVGPKRLHPTPTPLESLPHLDAVIISHDHYDHLDLPSVLTLVRTQDAPFVVPLGIGAHLRRWGVPADRIVELDWNGEHKIGEVILTCTEARHFSGRGLKRNNTLWSSWALSGPRHRVFFGGDTGYSSAFADIGAALGPFDLSLMPIGAYGNQWPDIHTNPEEAVQAHLDIDGGLFVPIHWATFNLAFHLWAEPADRVTSAAGRAGVELRIPKPGQRLDVEALLPYDDWWTATA